MPVTLTAVPGLPLFHPGDDLAGIIMAALAAAAMALADGDVLVLAQKIVSKVEDRFVDLATVTPSGAARDLAAIIAKDPRLVEVILSESRGVIRARPGVLIVEHRAGMIMANAGIDTSNVAPADGAERVLLLPRDCDASAAALRAQIAARTGRSVGVIINDSFGRAWRQGTVGVALGVAGLPAVLDMRGQPDLFGRILRVTETGFADEIAAAASLLMGQADEGCPVILVRGLTWSQPASDSRPLLRPRELDLFR
jgi:coenzyme F420-0:L-glutamate ligase/coenzyme F420-1:gamma-L-glutamate ligase